MKINTWKRLSLIFKTGAILVPTVCYVVERIARPNIDNANISLMAPIHVNNVSDPVIRTLVSESNYMLDRIHELNAESVRNTIFSQLSLYWIFVALGFAGIALCIDFFLTYSREK